MSMLMIIALLTVALLSGVALGYFLRHLLSLSKKTSLELKLKQMELKAQEQAQKIIQQAEKEAERKITEAKNQIKEQEFELKKFQERLTNKEALLDKRQEELDKEYARVTQKADQLAEKEKELANKLEELSGLSKQEAKQALLEQAEEEYKEVLFSRMQKLEQFGEEKLEEKAKEILTTAIHRLGNSMPAEVLTTTITIPNDEIKGKIIGKEGRNIRAFERATGVDLIIDETPGTITLSSFDPVRRQIARVALENLIIDGRIQPARIEEEVEKAKEEINRIINKKGAEAAYEAGVKGLDPKLLAILGRLHFRTSYGQNVLAHSVEMAHIAGIIAEEIGADVEVARAGALLHDIGKAVDHEVPGTHVEIGRRILQKFGVDKKIIHAMEAHHEEYPYATPESYIVQVADAISGGRPGARRGTIENYIKRLEELEAIVNEFPGIDKSYAVSAGREIRVFVRPEEIDDLQAHKLARDIAQKIEQDMKYPGEIKVMVIRETRAIEHAR